MTRRHETHKKFIRTVINQLPAYIKQYNPADQLFLNKFLDILRICETNLDSVRIEVLSQLERYCQQYRRHPLYSTLPFLWFSVSYFGNANRILSTTDDYHAEDFLEYLVFYLRNNSQFEGIFQLIKRQTSLQDSTWEIIQYQVVKAPLLKEYELQVLKLIYSLISKSRFQILNPKKLTKLIISNTSFFKNFKQLSRFFHILECSWYLQFNFEAFDLMQVFFLFQVDKSTAISELIDFKNNTNTVLCTSNVYRIPDIPNTFTGFLIIPNNTFNHLNSIIDTFKRDGKLRSYEVQKITNFQISASLSHYFENKGWILPSSSRWNQIVRNFNSTNFPKTRTPSNSLFITPPLNSSWNFHLLENPLEGIRLYCKATRMYRFEELPLVKIDGDNTSYLSRFESALLRKLYGAKIASIAFYPLRLISEFGLDRYLIKVPKVPFDQLERILFLFPFSQIYSTDMEYIVWTSLPTILAKQIGRDLRWNLMQIIQSHVPHSYSINWFDPDKLQWFPPKIFKKREE